MGAPRTHINIRMGATKAGKIARDAGIRAVLGTESGDVVEVEIKEGEVEAEEEEEEEEQEQEEEE